MKRSALLLAITSLVAVGTAQAQVGTLSSVTSVTLNATQASTLVVTANTPASSIASIAAGTTTEFAPAVNVTTAWNLTGGANVQLVGYFGTPSQALASGTNYIASNLVEGRIGAAGFAPFTGPAVGGVAGVAGGSLVLFTQALGALAGTRTDDINIRLNFTGQPAPAAGSYIGTLNLRAVVQ